MKRRTKKKQASRFRRLLASWQKQSCGWHLRHWFIGQQKPVSWSTYELDRLSHNITSQLTPQEIFR